MTKKEHLLRFLTALVVVFFGLPTNTMDMQQNPNVQESGGRRKLAQEETLLRVLRTRKGMDVQGANRMTTNNTDIEETETGNMSEMNETKMTNCEVGAIETVETTNAILGHRKTGEMGTVFTRETRIRDMGVGLVKKDASSVGRVERDVVGVEEEDEDGGVGAGVALREVVKRYLSSCHLVLVQAGGGAPSLHSSTFQHILRSVSGVSKGMVMVDAERESTWSSSSPLVQHLREGGEAHFTCRAVILHLTHTLAPALRFLEATHAWAWPDMRVVAVGPPILANTLLAHPAIANAAHRLYLVNEAEITENIKRGETGWLGKKIARAVEGVSEEEVEVLGRCHYCQGGEAGTHVLDTWHPQKGFTERAHLFPDEFTNCHGHRFMVVSMDWFPFLSFTRHPDNLTVTPLDSLDVRMLTAVANVMNFTYEIRMPSDKQWGRQEGGNWTGTMGTLQRHEADFSMLLNWSFERRRAIDFTRIYAAEPLVILSAKPRPKPRYLALITPFTGLVWACVVAIVGCVGVVYWLLGWAWWRVCGGRGGNGDGRMGCGSALLQTFALLLGDTPFKLPTALTTQMLVGWWCLFGLLVTAAYRSSLIAHLSVPGRGVAVDRFEDLVREAGAWTWGLEPTYGAEWEWFKSSASPVVQRIFEGIEVLDTEQHLRRVLGEQHALLTWEYYIRTLIISRYTDSRGYSPLHVSGAQYYVSTGYGWGFRKGAPFLRRVDKVIQRLVEAGLVNYWLDDLIVSVDTVETAGGGGRAMEKQGQEGVGARGIVLSVDHLQGSFYLLMLGCLAALLTLAGEILSHRH